VTAFSDGPGQGSRFVVRLPCLVHGPEDGQEDGTGSDDAPSDSVRRILIVDDNKDAADTLARLLRILGHDVRAAYGGSDGLRIAEEWRPDVALLDVGMPDLDGLEVCRRIRTLDWGSEATLIALTGWGQVEDRLKTEAAGFDHHLTKPVDTSELLSRLGHRGAGLPTART